MSTGGMELRPPANSHMKEHWEQILQPQLNLEMMEAMTVALQRLMEK